MRVFVFVLLAAVCGCSVGRSYKRPEIATPTVWRAPVPNADTAWPSQDWWRGFQSPQLNDFIEQAHDKNDDIAAAIARVVQADAQVRISGAALFPSIDVNLDATRQRQIFVSGTTTATQFNASLGASYELDFWGKNRALRNAARAAAAASRYDRATVELSVMTGVATMYFQILELRERLDVAQNNFESASQILDGLRLELNVGTVNALDVAQQATTVAALNAALPALRQQLQQSIDALAILLGRSPESLEVAPATLADLIRPEVQSGMPSELLARRPDVAEAEAQLIAANANITAARAAMFPSISLTGSGGFVNSAISTLFEPANRVFAIGADLTQPIFAGGQLTGRLDLSKGRYAELLANYHKTVISAFGNAEDALVAAQETAKQETLRANAEEAAQHAYDIALEQMHAGVVNILTVLNTETALFSARDALVQARFLHLQALINLFSALGGGWQTQQEFK